MPNSFVQLPPDGPGKKMRTFEQDVSGDLVHEVYNQIAEGDTWVYTSPVITPAANKLFVAFLNTTAGQKLSLRGLWMIRDNTAVTGVYTTFELKRISAIVGGSAITAQIMDSDDAALTGVTCVSSPTSATEGVLLFPWYGSGEETIPAGTGGNPISNPVYMSFTNFIPNVPAMKTPRFNNGEGFALKMVTGAAGSGNWVINMILSKEL